MTTAFDPPRTSGLSIVALVTAFVLPLAAIVVGHIAINRIRRTGEAGLGLARAGTTLGYVFSAAGLIAIGLLTLWLFTLAGA